MATRHPFPLNELLIGTPSSGSKRGVPALLTHNTVLELFLDLACTSPLDATTLDGSAPITSVTVQGVTIPGFLGPSNDALNIVYAREAGTVGNGFALYRIDALGSTGGGGTDVELVRDTIAAALVPGGAITITTNDPGDTITITATDTNTTDPEVVRDTMAGALVAGPNVTVTPNDGADTITITAATDPEVVRDTMAVALVAGANVTITPNDAGDTITIASSGGGATDVEVVRDTIGAALVAGTGMTVTVNDAGDTITLAVNPTTATDPEVVRDTIAAALVAGSGMTVTVDDAANTITLASTFVKGTSTARAAADATPVWKTVFTGSLATTVQNIVEHDSKWKAGVTVGSFVTAWLNEWGALRGTSPYTWGDALLRAVRQSGDGITAGNFAELDDRSTGSSFLRWGRTWLTGALIRNGYAVRETYVWATGDADPTVGGTVALPANATWIISLSTLGGTVPSWAPAGSLIVEPAA